jgi:DNA-directed RNA polymerase specialized sigma24 family protein
VELTAEAFDKLLARFSLDRDEAARQYEIARTKLIRFFQWRGAEFTDALSDETLDRVARRLDEGVQIENLPSYIHSVAQHVWMESRKPKPTVAWDDIPEIDRQQVVEEPESQVGLDCLDQCLESLPADSRELIMDYYQAERRAKIELRQQLAEKLDIPLNALRIRAHRIRATLEKCVTKCVELAAEAK